jgi:hypothetical protein
MTNMKSYQLLAIIAVIFSATSCVNSEEDITVAASTATSFSPLSSASTVGATISADQCFAMKMDYWYSAFNYYQANGYAMEIADQKAVAYSERMCKPCMSFSDKN